MLTAISPSPTQPFQVEPAGQKQASRAAAWCTVVIGSKLPQILCAQFGHDPGLVLPAGQIVGLSLLFLVARSTPSLQKIAGFILAVTALSFAWLIVVPWLETLPFFTTLAAKLSWIGRFALARLIRGVGAVLMILSLMGSGLRPRDLFLRIGNWRAPVGVNPSPSPRRFTLRWSHLTLGFLLLSFVVIPLFYLCTLHPQAKNLRYFMHLLPLAIPLAIFNAANEEFQFRSVLLARLRDALPPGEAFLLSGALFGIDHYFGQPAGWGGMVLAGLAGWVWAMSMWETRGFTCAFVMHFVEDILILAFFFTAVAT